MTQQDPCPYCGGKGTYAVTITSFGAFWVFRCHCCGYGDRGEIKEEKGE